MTYDAARTKAADTITITIGDLGRISILGEALFMANK
jgi:hypothetical protein